MSKRYNIKWKQSDNQELAKAVKNFNAKITRLEKKYDRLIEQSGSAAERKQLRKMKNALPERTSVKSMKDLIGITPDIEKGKQTDFFASRQDFRREVNALKRFTKRDAEEIVELPDTYYNLMTTKWQKQEMVRRASIINRKRANRLENIASIDMTDRGKKTGYTRGQLGMGRLEEAALQPITVTTYKMESSDFRARYNMILKESQSTFWDKKDLILKRNYIRSLEENFNSSDVAGIVQAIDDMPFEDFYKIYQAEGGNFEWNYPPDDEEYQKYLTYLKSLWMPHTVKGEYIGRIEAMFGEKAEPIIESINNADSGSFLDKFRGNMMLDRYEQGPISKEEYQRLYKELKNTWMGGK